ncbi:uncharacterized protein RHOBADRAFT_41429 [Rhodotorula graminis WP1]|uniref:Uncharacterized protein n=1 Tax=Rhodotorula graminis (strain WP1) TaxID=578459 RepID=A0A194SDG0_RHOGW|nr:uncharacterized protein RHOBADRAFT_41429 [Rhodotorula graminis WP1]KPV77436.1 hypothetical protein RHOBADRAFT_41429 [Rhodotorula graminis WP1]
MPPTPVYARDEFRGVLPAPGDGPVEHLGPKYSDLVPVLRIVKGSRRDGHRIFPDHHHVVKAWGTDACSYLSSAWRSASPERRSAFKRSLELFYEALQAVDRANPDILPSYENMRIFLASPHIPHRSPGLEPAHPASSTAPPTPPAPREQSLAKAPRPLLGLRAAARYGLDKDEWERRADAAHGRFW